MSIEDDFKTAMLADVVLAGVLTGGIYTSGAVGVEGITRSSAPDAFDIDGYLLPCALVKEADVVPDNAVVDDATPAISVTQRVEIWLYDHRDYTALDAAILHLIRIFQGEPIGDSFELELATIVNRRRDEGALKGAALARVDFRAAFVLTA